MAIFAASGVEAREPVSVFLPEPAPFSLQEAGLEETRADFANSPPLLVSPPGNNASAPSVSSRKYLTSITWTAENEASGTRQAFALNFHDGRLAPAQLFHSPRPLDPDAGGDASDPSVAINPANLAPAFAWVIADEDGSTLRFREGLGRTAIETVRESEGRIELPDIAFDSEGTPFLAWTELDGGISRLFAATKTAEQGWRIFDFQDNSRTYEILPFLCETGQDMALFWYSLEGTEFITRSALLSSETFSPTEMRGLEKLPASQLPLLFNAQPAEIPGAVYFQPVEQGEELIYYDPLLEDRELSGRLVLTRKDSPNAARQPAVADIPHPPVVFIEDSAADGRFLVLIDSLGDEVRLPVSSSASSPAVSLSEGWTHLVWMNDPSEGGDGSLRYLRLRVEYRE